MGLKFNPLTAQFDLTGSGGGSSYIDGEVAVYADLPLSSTAAPLNTAWLVRGSSGIWPFTKPGGVYVRTATGGSSRDADYTYAGIFPDVFSDANFTLYDDSDTSKNAKFQLSGISTGTTRTITVPDANITLDDAGDSRTPTAHAASHAAGTKAQYSGQVTGMTGNVFIRANNAGTAGNSITLTFDGVDDIDTVLAAWNSANPSNQATLIVGDGSQVPDNGEEITLSGGTTAGSDPISDPVFNSIGVGTLSPLDSGKIVAVATETTQQESVLKALSSQNSDLNWRGRIMAGAKDLTCLMGTYDGVAGLGAHSWNDSLTESGAEWADVVINPDGGANTLIGCSGWDKATAILKVGNGDGKVTISDQAFPTKKFNFDVSGVTAGQTRSLEVPDASGVIALQGEITTSGLTQATGRLLGRTTAGTGAVQQLTVGSGLTLASGSLTANFAAPPEIGNTTPAAGSFTNLSASAELKLPTNAPASPAAGDLYRVSNTLRYRDSTNTERLLLNASDNLANLASASTARANLGVGSSDAVTFASLQGTPIGSTSASSGVFTTLSANNGTITASAPMLDLSQTWNNAAVTFTALQQTITNTASANGSRLFNFVVGGTSALAARTMVGVLATEALCINGGDRGLVFGSNTVTNPANAFFSLRWQSNIAGFNSSAILAWGSDVYNLSYDLALQRDAADTLAQRRGANAQTFRLYNTYTDASNYERGFMRWSSNVLQIGTEKAGTGSARALEFQTDGTMRGGFASDGGFYLNNSSYSTGTSFHFQPAANRGGMWVYEASFELASSSATMRGGPNATDWIRMSLGRLMFSGTTNAFPALKRSSTALQVRLADDSAYSVLDAQLRAQGTAPATSGATGTAGDIRYDADYIYVCTAANTWKRAAIATW